MVVKERDWVRMVSGRRLFFFSTDYNPALDDLTDYENNEFVYIY